VGSKKESRGSEQLVLDAVRSGMQFQKVIADAALKVWHTLQYIDLLESQFQLASVSALVCCLFLEDGLLIWLQLKGL